MAKGARDLILRDRLQFDLDASGDRALVYGRVDLSDFVNIIKKEGMAIKEIRYNLRLPAATNGVLSPTLSIDGDASINLVRFYGTPDLHPEGYNVVSDLLVGVAVDNAAKYADSTLELDIMIIGEPVKLSDADMTEMLTQAQDL